jgi:DNA polymerase I-like protein with 3'-5' exonuclease and polymerase domains
MNIITTVDQLNEMVAHYLTQDAFAFDVETVGDNRGITKLNEVLWITFATHGRCDVIPMGHPNGDFVEEVFPLTGQGEKRVEAGLTARPSDYSRDKKKALKKFGLPPAQLYPAQVFKRLKPILFNSSLLTVGHNLIFDLTSVAKYYNGEVPTGPYFDTMIASFISDNRNKNKCGLDACLKREFGYEMVKGVGKEVEKYSFDEVAKYAFLDAKYTFLLWKALSPKITASDLDVIMKLEMDVLEVLCAMKLEGAPIDVTQLEELDTQLREDIETARAEIFKIAERPFNINSNQEKQLLLYGPKDSGGRGLKPKILTTAGARKSEQGVELTYSDYSVSAEALEAYKLSDPLVDAMLTYADLNKLSTTYVVPYLGGEVVRTTAGKEKREHKESLLINGRIHCDFVQHGAETGRFSSRNPNLQNVPAPHTAHGKAIRNLFFAPEGYKLVVADYSQIEPRVIASMSKDPIMLDNYLKGKDIYTTVGETMGVDRKAGKVLVLAMAYGVGPDKISRQIGCSINEARDLLSRFGAEFSSVSSYRVKVIGATRVSSPPCVTTILGRKRYLPDLNSSDHFLRSAAERQAFNTRIQGSAADIIKLAMVRAYKRLPEGARLLLTVHDELVTLAPNDRVDDTVSAIREAMEGIELLSVPLVADIKVVDRWGEAK